MGCVRGDLSPVGRWANPLMADYVFDISLQSCEVSLSPVLQTRKRRQRRRCAPSPLWCPIQTRFCLPNRPRTPSASRLRCPEHESTTRWHLYRFPSLVPVSRPLQSFTEYSLHAASERGREAESFREMNTLRRLPT